MKKYRVRVTVISRIREVLLVDAESEEDAIEKCRDNEGVLEESEDVEDEPTLDWSNAVAEEA